MNIEEKILETNCPICNKSFDLKIIEKHVEKCLFLNTAAINNSPKRKRPLSPVLFNSQQSSGWKQKRPSNSLTQINDTSIIAPLFQSQLKNKESITSNFNSESISQNTSNSSLLSFAVPLAKQVQPKTLNDFFGQNHVLGKDTVLRSLLEQGEIPNMILWGPPGCGKTSLSGIIHEMCKRESNKFKFTTLGAATCGVKDVQSIVTIAKNDLKFGRRTVLFMDEIHRFNKKQQDVFLLSVERGDITLIGATTENPSFSINNALLSRCRVIVMQKLDMEDLYSILERVSGTLEVDVVDTENPCGILEDNSGLGIEQNALKWLADISDGDARIALTNLQLAIQYNNKNGKIITLDEVKNGIKKSHMLYDRAGEEHYNIISAMHKSIRGSDENAALYWTTRMMVSGEDPRYIARRMIRAASEDIGNADPQALQLAVATMKGCESIGMPECEVLLAQCAIYLARAPKSREADKALAKAKRVILECKGAQPSVPMHLRNAPTKLMKDLGYGKLQTADFGYMPPDLNNLNFFS